MSPGQGTPGVSRPSGAARRARAKATAQRQARAAKYTADMEHVRQYMARYNPDTCCPTCRAVNHHLKEHKP